ncbi:MSMEG_1061 family FMN-dependent PPOX-type flavoprotein [Spirillospora sp. NPDC029432]|uniref:MSMEG_1061 family FMN-dependent PPOX-type flavoprotein n=1 Tax=Spirillospora sp. NPDC029432 TaxID=3154599 RepID=UPI0034511B5D
MPNESLSDYEHDAVDSAERLREAYGEPSRIVIDKVADHVDATMARFVGAASLVMIGSRGRDGRMDVTPRGGAPGFVRVLGERLIAVPDLAGNRRIDTLLNVAETGRVGALFLVPGRPDTFRINGPARISMRPELLDHLHVDGKPPVAALLIEPEEAYMHCPRSLTFSNAWQPENWLPPEAVPSVKEMIDARIAAATGTAAPATT